MAISRALLSRRIYLAILRVGFALAISLVLTRFEFDYLEALFYDARIRLKPQSPVSGTIETILIDPQTVERLGRVPNAEDHLDLLAVLGRARPRAVIYLIDPRDVSGEQKTLVAMVKAATALPNFHVAVADVALKGETDAFRLPPPFDALSAVSAPATKDGNIFARDGVTRRMLLSYHGQQMLYPLVAGLFNSEVADESRVRGTFEYLSSTQAYIDFRPAQTYPSTSFAEAIRAPAQDGRFHDKIVIVGRDIQTTSKDYVLTPFSRDIVAMTAVELTANMLDTLILNSAPVRAPGWLDVIFTSLISVITVYVVLSVRPTRGLLVLAATIVGFTTLALLLFWLGGLWLNMAHPFLSIFICYYFFIPYRLIMENRRSWEYQQKNRLLTQVEELKTNFLRMMSHDLKTPIARIQGMTELVLKDANPLSPRQREALNTLERSSQELLEFVSSILNLGRIESKELKLHVKSRDLNVLLDEVIAKYHYLAKTKNIEVIAEFEPLFSIRIDADLMRQVFSNLLENAIKYSPENSRILVTSEEQNGRILVQFADQGQGIPEDELAHVFTKFYRSRNAKASSIKGSGLGLYLAKYFVELHKGCIAVDSRLGEGSTFTVELPSELEGPVAVSRGKAGRDAADLFENDVWAAFGNDDRVGAGKMERTGSSLETTN